MHKPLLTLLIHLAVKLMPLLPEMEYLPPTVPEAAPLSMK